MRIATVMVVLLAAMVRVPVSAATPARWTPPLGVPEPLFGIRQSAPPAPRPWPSERSRFYFVDGSNPAASDAGNPQGTPTRPRATIPTRLPAGAIVELRGTYHANHTSPRGLTAGGTMAAPVFIRGESATTRPVVTGCWEVSGSYVVIEHVEFSDCGSVVLLAPVDHAVLRHSEVHGTARGGGVGVQSWNGGFATEIVVWDNAIHDNGDVRAAFDQDVHGIAVGPRVSALWIVDNDLARNSGDGVQINAGSAALQPTTHHIYVGRNVAYANKQSGLWTKQAEDVIFSENVSYGHRPGNSSAGVCMGGQYGPERVWFLNNVMWDCDYGIQLASDSGLGTGQTIYVIGNIIRQIHDSTGRFNAETAWQPCGISLPGGTMRYVVQNSLYDIDSGICVPYESGQLVLYDNIVQGIRAEGFHLRFDSPALAARTQARGNVFAPFYRIGAGPDVTVVGPQAVGPRGSNQVVADAGWVDAAAGNFRLSRDSAAVGNGMADQLELWAIFLKRYGLFTARDLYGAMRVLRIPDSGAIEYEGRR